MLFRHAPPCPAERTDLFWFRTNDSSKTGTSLRTLGNYSVRALMPCEPSVLPRTVRPCTQSTFSAPLRQSPASRLLVHRHGGKKKGKKKQDSPFANRCWARQGDTDHLCASQEGGQCYWLREAVKPISPATNPASPFNLLPRLPHFARRVGPLMFRVSFPLAGVVGIPYFDPR